MLCDSSTSSSVFFFSIVHLILGCFFFFFFFFLNSNRKLLEKEVEAVDDLDGCLLLLQRAWRILRKIYACLLFFTVIMIRPLKCYLKDVLKGTTLGIDLAI